MGGGGVREREGVGGGSKREGGRERAGRERERRGGGGRGSKREGEKYNNIQEVGMKGK